MLPRIESEDGGRRCNLGRGPSALPRWSWLLEEGREKCREVTARRKYEGINTQNIHLTKVMFHPSPRAKAKVEFSVIGIARGI